MASAADMIIRDNVTASAVVILVDDLSLLICMDSRRGM